MALSTPDLHRTFLAVLRGRCSARSSLEVKPLVVQMDPPLPGLARIYAYNLVGGSTTSRGDIDYKASLRLPGQPNGEYASFDHSDGHIALLVGYRQDLDVWVLWDASLHPVFKNGGNIQVRNDTVLAAAGSGASWQHRRLSTGGVELVLACTSSHLPATLIRRVDNTGGSYGSLAG